MSLTFIKKTHNPPANLAHAEEVLAEHGDFVRKILRFHIRNQGEREDLFQEFFIELTSRPIPEDVQNVRGYIYNVVCHNIRHSFRRIERYQKRLRKYAEHRRHIIEDRPENDLIETEEIEKIFELIHRHLPKNEAKAMEQRYKHDRNISETAAKMGVKPKSVSRYLSAGAKKLRQVLSIRPDAGLLMKIADPPHRQEGLREVHKGMDKMNDYQLAEIVDEIRNCAEDILRGGSSNANYKLLREIIAKLPKFKPQRYIQTWYHFLGLLSDIFGLCREGQLNGQAKEDMAFPIKDAVGQVDKLHLDGLKGIVSDIMADPESKSALTIIIAGTLSTLEGNEKQEIRQFIFDEYKKRAIRYPRKSSHHFWRVVKEMKHRVFWLDIESLHNILVDPQNYSKHGLISSNRPAYSELCEGVFAPLEEVGEGESRHGRVFRRLEGEKGKVIVECTFKGDNPCRCEGESLSFRGLYCPTCQRSVGEHLKTKVIPILEFQSGNNVPEHEFAFTTKITELHVHDPDDPGRRGLFFEDGEDETIQNLYRYISQPVVAT